jgi:hypothetical protein
MLSQFLQLPDIAPQPFFLTASHARLFLQFSVFQNQFALTAARHRVIVRHNNQCASCRLR